MKEGATGGPVYREKDQDLQTSTTKKLSTRDEMVSRKGLVLLHVFVRL